MYMLCIYIYWQFILSGTWLGPRSRHYAPEAANLLVSGQAADLVRHPPPVEYAWPLQAFWRRHSARPGLFSPLTNFVQQLTAGRFQVWVLLCPWCGPYLAEGQPCLWDQHLAVELWTAPASRGRPLCGQNWEDLREVSVRGCQLSVPSADGQLSWLARDLHVVYTWYIHGIYMVYPWCILSDGRSCLLNAIK